MGKIYPSIHPSRSQTTLHRNTLHFARGTTRCSHKTACPGASLGPPPSQAWKTFRGRHHKDAWSPSTGFSQCGGAVAVLPSRPGWPNFHSIVNPKTETIDKKENMGWPVIKEMYFFSLAPFPLQWSGTAPAFVNLTYKQDLKTLKFLHLRQKIYTE